MVVLVDFFNVLLNVEKRELEKDVVNLLIELREKSVPLYLFTNISSIKLGRYEEEFHYKQYFDGVVDGDRFLKPNPKAYERLEEETGYRYEDMIFVDDSERNIEIGESFGIKGIVYKGVEDLREKLKGFNLK